MLYFIVSPEIIKMEILYKNYNKQIFVFKLNYSQSALLEFCFVHPLQNFSSNINCFIIQDDLLFFFF